MFYRSGILYNKFAFENRNRVIEWQNLAFKNKNVLDDQSEMCCFFLEYSAQLHKNQHIDVYFDKIACLPNGLIV